MHKQYNIIISITAKLWGLRDGLILFSQLILIAMNLMQMLLYALWTIQKNHSVSLIFLLMAAGSFLVEYHWRRLKIALNS